MILYRAWNICRF